MPSDTYILTISEAGVSVPSTHGSTHISGGSDPIPTATASASGLMSAAMYSEHVANNAKISNKTHTGDVTDASGVLTVNKIKGIDLSTFPNNSILKTTTGGIVAPAVAEDFPILNQSTTGNAATATSATFATTAGSATSSTTAASATTATTAINIAGGSIGAVPYQLASGTTSLLSAGTSGYVLTANGTSSAPSWSPIDLSADIGGILPVGKGGTGAVTLTGYVKGTGTTEMTAATTVPVEDISGTLPISSGGTGATSLTTGYVKSNGTTLTSVSTIPASDITGLPSGLGEGGLTTDVTGILPVTYGGTGASVFDAGYLKSDGTTLTSETIVPISDLDGVLPLSKGGTGSDLTDSVGFIYSDGSTCVTSGTISATTQISGVVPIANGGTGYSSTSRGVLYRATSSNTINNAGTGSWHPINGQGTLDGGINMSVGAANRFSLKNNHVNTRIYVIEARARLLAGATPTGSALFSMRLYRGYENGAWTPVDESLVGSNRSVTTAGDGQYLATSCIVQLAPTQEVAIYMSQSSSGTLTMYSTDCYLSAFAII